MFINLSPLKRRNFRYAFIGEFVSSFGSQLTMVAIPFQVYQLTHSTFHTGLVSLVELVCLLTTLFWGGIWADTKEKRKLLIFSDLFLMLSTFILFCNTYWWGANVGIIYLGAAMNAAFGGIQRPVMQAIGPLLVAKEEVAIMTPVSTLSKVITSVIGPASAGFLMAKYGASITYGIDFFTFLISLFCLFQLSKFPPSEQNAQKKSFFSSIAEGFHYVKSHEELVGTYVIDFFAMVFCMPYALFPALAEFYQKKEWVGTLYMLPAIGALLFSLFSRWTEKVKRQGRAVTFAASLWAVSIAFIGLSDSFIFLVVGLFFAGFFDMVSGNFRLTIWNTSIPENYRGRLASFETLSYMSGPLLGNAISGFSAEKFGLHQALLIGGSVSIILIAVSSYRLKKFWRYLAK